MEKKKTSYADLCKSLALLLADISGIETRESNGRVNFIIPNNLLESIIRLRGLRNDLDVQRNDAMEQLFANLEPTIITRDDIRNAYLDILSNGISKETGLPIDPHIIHNFKNLIDEKNDGHVTVGTNIKHEGKFDWLIRDKNLINLALALKKPASILKNILSNDMLKAMTHPHVIALVRQFGMKLDNLIDLYYSRDLEYLSDPKIFRVLGSGVNTLAEAIKLKKDKWLEKLSGDDAMTFIIYFGLKFDGPDGLCELIKNNEFEDLARPSVMKLARHFNLDISTLRKLRQDKQLKLLCSEEAGVIKFAYHFGLEFDQLLKLCRGGVFNPERYFYDSGNSRGEVIILLAEKYYYRSGLKLDSGALLKLHDDGRLKFLSSGNAMRLARHFKKSLKEVSESLDIRELECLTSDKVTEFIKYFKLTFEDFLKFCGKDMLNDLENIDVPCASYFSDMYLLGAEEVLERHKDGRLKPFITPAALGLARDFKLKLKDLEDLDSHGLLSNIEQFNREDAIKLAEQYQFKVADLLNLYRNPESKFLISHKVRRVAKYYKLSRAELLNPLNFPILKFISGDISASLSGMQFYKEFDLDFNDLRRLPDAYLEKPQVFDFAKCLSNEVKMNKKQLLEWLGQDECLSFTKFDITPQNVDEIFREYKKAFAIHGPLSKPLAEAFKLTPDDLVALYDQKILDIVSNEEVIKRLNFVASQLNLKGDEMRNVILSMSDPKQQERLNAIKLSGAGFADSEIVNQIRDNAPGVNISMKGI